MLCSGGLSCPQWNGRDTLISMPAQSCPSQLVATRPQGDTAAVLLPRQRWESGDATGSVSSTSSYQEAAALPRCPLWPRENHVPAAGRLCPGEPSGRGQTWVPCRADQPWQTDTGAGPSCSGRPLLCSLGGPTHLLQEGFLTSTGLGGGAASDPPPQAPSAGPGVRQVTGTCSESQESIPSSTGRWMAGNGCGSSPRGEGGRQRGPGKDREGRAAQDSRPPSQCPRRDLPCRSWTLLSSICLHWDWI